MGSVPIIGSGAFGADRPGAQAAMQTWRHPPRVPAVPLPVRVSGAVGVRAVNDDGLAIHHRPMRAGAYRAYGTGGPMTANGIGPGASPRPRQRRAIADGSVPVPG